MDRILVGVSGGVDSLFAAIYLKEQGFDVSAMHLYLHSKSNISKEAEDILKNYAIELFYADYTNEFQKYVVNYFTKEYSLGYTPNPCVICNRDIKLPMLFKEAQKMNIDKIATGHYADIDKQGYIIRHKSKKDQSYFLACVDRKILKQTIFPLKNHTKEEIAQKLKFKAKESADLCFIKNNYREFLKKRLGSKEGKIVKENRIVGYHNGFYNYTIGQRKGLQIGNKPHYVVSIDAKHNIIYADYEDKLFSSEFYLESLKLLEGEQFFINNSIECSVRYNAKAKPCKLNIPEKKVMLSIKERAITPGQVAVFYSNDRVVACGKIGYGIH